VNQNGKDLIAPAPPKKSRGSIVEFAPPPSTQTVDNLSKSAEPTKLVDLNFKVPEQTHRKFKMVATGWGMSMKDLFEASFQTWLEKNGTLPADQGDLLA
jgi:hypothetical protein